MAIEDMTQKEQTHIQKIVDRGPVFYRTEIFDSSLIISYFTAEPTPYPTTYHYEKESFYYETYFIDFHQTFNLAQISLPLDAKTTEQELRNFLQSIGGNPDEIPQLRQEAKVFRTEFLTQLGWETHF